MRKANKLHAQTAVKLPYAKEIESFDENWLPEYKKEDMYETDLLIYEENERKRVPRVVIEAKFQKVTTHDAIIYSEKATEHKALMPFLRYGIMIGAMEEAELPWRLVSHGSDFDFMFACGVCCLICKETCVLINAESLLVKYMAFPPLSQGGWPSSSSLP